ncbi:hypothetical protein ACB087_16970 [Vibrio sp. VNB-15]
MKVVFLGISQRKGISNKGMGNPYEMNKIHLAVPMDEIHTQHMTSTGFGVQERQLDIDPLCLPQFQQLKPFVEIDVTVEPKPNNFNQTWVVGLTK